MADPNWCREQYITYATGDEDAVKLTGKTRTAMFMRPWMARLWFRVERVRVEQVNAITEEDARLEGTTRGEDRSYVHSVLGLQYEPYRVAYSRLWDSINGKGCFDQGVWVWVYDLRRIDEKELERLRAQE